MLATTRGRPAAAGWGGDRRPRCAPAPPFVWDWQTRGVQGAWGLGGMASAGAGRRLYTSPQAASSRESCGKPPRDAQHGGLQQSRTDSCRGGSLLDPSGLEPLPSPCQAPCTAPSCRLGARLTKHCLPPPVSAHSTKQRSTARSAGTQGRRHGMPMGGSGGGGGVAPAQRVLWACPEVRAPLGGEVKVYRAVCASRRAWMRRLSPRPQHREADGAGRSHARVQAGVWVFQGPLSRPSPAPSQRATYNVQHTTYNVQRTTYVVHVSVGVGCPPCAPAATLSWWCWSCGHPIYPVGAGRPSLWSCLWPHVRAACVGPTTGDEGTVCHWECPDGAGQNRPPP